MGEKKIDINNKNLYCLWFGVCIGFIFLYGLIFPGITYLEINTLGFVMSILAGIGFFIERRMEFDLAFIFLFQAMFIMALKDDMAQNRYEVCYGWILVSAYLIGKFAVGNKKEHAEAKIISSYIALALGVIITGIVDIIYNHVIGYFDTEWIISIWTNETIGRTVYDLYGLLMVSAIPFFVVMFKKLKIISVLGIILAIFYTLAMVRNEGRYCLFVFILLVPVTFVIYTYYNWHTISVEKKKKLKNIVTMIACLMVLLLICFFFNIFGLNDLYHSSYISVGGIFDNIRFKLAYQAIMNIPYNLQGGYSNDLRFNAHNTWLEFGNSYGVIVLVLLIAFRIILIYDMFISFLKRSMPKSLTYLFVPSFIFINIYFSMEPIGFRRRLYFALILFYFGIFKRAKELFDK